MTATNTPSRTARTAVLLSLVLVAGPLASAGLAVGFTTAGWSAGPAGPAVPAGPMTADVAGSVGDAVDDTIDDTIDDTTDDTTDTVDDTTDDATDGTTDTTDGTTGTANDTVNRTAETVENATDEATGTVDDTVDDTTGAVDVGTGSVTGSVDAALGASLGTTTTPGGADPTTTTAATNGSRAGGADGVVTARVDGATPPSGGPRGGGLAAAAGGVAAIGAATLAGAALLNRSTDAAAWWPSARDRSVTPRDWIRWVAGWAGYSRYDDSDPLVHDTRRSLFDRIEDAPGVHLSALAESADVPLSTARHHLRVLEGEGVVQVEKLGGRRCYFPASTERPALAAALADETQAALLETLSDRGHATVSALADDIDRDPSTVTHHLQRLEAAGVVEREREGRRVVNRLSADVEPLVGRARAGPPTD